MHDGRGFLKRKKMIKELLQSYIEKALKDLFNNDFNNLQFQDTRKEFQGDITLVVFNLLKISKKDPENTAEVLGTYLLNNTEEVIDYNVVKGFLNLTISDSYWLSEFANAYIKKTEFGFTESLNDSDVTIC